MKTLDAIVAFEKRGFGFFGERNEQEILETCLGVWWLFASSFLRFLFYRVMCFRV